MTDATKPSVSERLRELAKALEGDQGTTAHVPDGDGNYLLAEHAIEALATEIEEREQALEKERADRAKPGELHGVDWLCPHCSGKLAVTPKWWAESETRWADQYANELAALRAALEKIEGEIQKQADDAYKAGRYVNAATTTDLQAWADALRALGEGETSPGQATSAVLPSPVEDSHAKIAADIRKWPRAPQYAIEAENARLRSQLKGKTFPLSTEETT